MVDRFCLLGNADAHQKNLRDLAAVGVTQFNIYLMCGDEEQTLDIYGKKYSQAISQLRSDPEGADRPRVFTREGWGF